MKKSPWLRAAFTLIELLTVIAIIAVLMGLLFPALNMVKESARKAQAGVDVRSIVTAIKAFQTEYGRYPTVAASSAADTIIAPANPNNNNNVMDILRCSGTGTTGNTRQIVYIEPKTAKKTGVVYTGGVNPNGVYYDPWGYAYGIAIDTNYDGALTVKGTNLAYTDIQSGTLQYGVAAWSWGKDNQSGVKGNKKLAGSDDVVSWQ